MAGKADMVLESFAPGYLSSLGLGYESLSRENPGLIVVPPEVRRLAIQSATRRIQRQRQ